ncbi:SMODS domain-containing nucleotidyltransferase [Providencia stuartii]|uniref:SMODS domain-containing nucleotidyltransferase n=1 Tax=Providencia stuartii TaxID=588 RepID=UPI0034E4D638
MIRSIDKAFEDFHDKIKTSVTETSNAKSHRASIKGCLDNNFTVKRFARIGSFGNGTNISGYSDVDYLACLSKSNLDSNSYRSLSNVKNALAIRFPNTNIRVSSPTVSCPFGSYRSEDTEIVVADYVCERNGFSVYKIADGSTGWIEISPDAHNVYVDKIDKQHFGKVKKLIRFIKAWKYYNNVPIKSFYLEMRVAKYAESESSIVYEIDIKRIFQSLLDSELSSMQDPMKVAGYITPCQSDISKNEALSKLKTAVNRSTNALNANSDEDKFYWWNLLFSEKFPSRYYY